MKFYKRFVGDYQRDTAHLSLAEHGAYTLMLDLYYGAENALPSDRKVLYRMMRADGRIERQAIDAVIDEFWIEADDGLRNPKADRMIADAGVRSEKASKSAHGMWKKRREADAFASDFDANAKRTHKKRIPKRICETDASHSQTPDSTIIITSANAAQHDDDDDGDLTILGDFKMAAEWKAAFPALDVEQQLRSMKAWLDANPSHRPANIKRFIVNWLTRNQDMAPPERNGANPTHAEDVAEAVEHLKTATFALVCEACREPRPVDRRFGLCPSCGAQTGSVGETPEDDRAYREWMRKDSRGGGA